MKDIFNSAYLAELHARIDNLSPDSKALWGKMTAAQMLSHLQAPVEIGLGDKKLKQGLIGLLFGRIAKKKLFSEKPFPRNLPTDPSFIRRDTRDFETEKQKLKTLLNRFQSAGPDGITKGPHPFFGKLTTTEWGTSLWKHFDHHLRQFGV